MVMSSLIEQICKGNRQSVVTFYRTYAPQIMCYLIQKLPRKEDAEDILNEVFFEAVDSLLLLKKEQKIEPWLYSIAHNKVVDFYRKKKIKAVLLSQAPFLEIVANEIHQPEFQFEKNKVRDKIEQALKSISTDYRRILQLHYEEKITVKDLAPLFNLSFKATESLLFRARQSFKKAYERT